MTCQRCSECPNQDHHWCTEILTDDGEHFQCKHCEATADECTDCGGAGERSYIEGDDDQELEEMCETCNGSGVIPRRTFDE